MGRVSDWLIEMEEDASCMTREEWTTKHGETVAEMYDKLKRQLEGTHVEPGEPDDVG